MSKVYEALQHAHAERQMRGQRHRAATSGVELFTIPALRRLPPLQMEREMGQLYRNFSALLSEGIIQFVEARKDEGASTILREFGLFLAERVGKSVLLVDADSQLPQHHALGIHPKTSLQQIMCEGGTVDEAVSQVSRSRIYLSCLHERTGGKSRTELATNHGGIWNTLRKAFDFVMIDSSPIGVSDEALSLCSSADAVILVVEAEKTRSRVVSHLKTRITQSGGNILGLVFNKQRYYIPDWIYKRL
jgi:Mrp family chromosome partitioning ATPase